MGSVCPDLVHARYATHFPARSLMNTSPNLGIMVYRISIMYNYWRPVIVLLGVGFVSEHLTIAIVQSRALKHDGTYHIFT